MSKRPMALVAVTLFLLLTGCTPSFKNPLSDPKNAKLDEAMLGVWREGTGDFQTYYHVGKSKKNSGCYEIIEVQHGDEQTVSSRRLLCFISEVNNARFLNVVDVDKPENEARYLFSKYSIDKNGKLNLFPPSITPFKAAIEEKKLEGTITPNTIGPPRVDVSDTTENILKFIEKADPKDLFPYETGKQLERFPPQRIDLNE